MSYEPSPNIARLLDASLGYVRSVAYPVTARWVFYRLLQDGLLSEKSDYKRLLGYLSKARKNFYGRARVPAHSEGGRKEVITMVLPRWAREQRFWCSLLGHEMHFNIGPGPSLWYCARCGWQDPDALSKPRQTKQPREGR